MTAALLALLLAHESSVSSSRLEFGDREVRATFTFSLEDLAGLARLDLDRNGTVDPDEWTRVLPALVAYVGDKFRVEVEGEPCRAEALATTLPAASMSDPRQPMTFEVRYRAPRPFDRATLSCALFGEHGGNPRHIAEIAGGRTLVFDRDRTRVEGVSAARTVRANFVIPAVLAVVAAVGIGVTALRRVTNQTV